MLTYDYLSEIMSDNYQTDNLVTLSPSEFENRIKNLLQLSDGHMEGFVDTSKQRDLSVRYHWGHNHDFGSFKVTGRMQNRHLIIPSKLVEQFKVFPLDLNGKKILDIGVWTGGTCLLFAALGADVVAIEEVKQYSDTLELLRYAFDIRQIKVLNVSLYDLNQEIFFDQFDYVLLSGVVYHVTDPILALRIAFNALKDGGKCMVETYGIESQESVIRYESGKKEDCNRGGWNYFIPSRLALKRMMLDVGFEDIQVGGVEDQRIIAVGLREKHCDMLRAGLSVRSIR